MTKFQTRSQSLKSTLSRLLRRPGRAVWAVLGALAVVAALGFAAWGLPGEDDGPDLGPGVRVGTPSSSRPGQPASTAVDPDEEDSDRPGHRDQDDADDLTTPVTPGSLPVAGDSDDTDDNSDESDHHADADRDRDHDGHGDGHGDDDADNDGRGAED